MRLVLNFVAFQAGWVACVLAAASGRPWLGTAIAIAIVAVHLGLMARGRSELALVVLAGLGGWLWDSLLVQGGLIVFASGTLLPGTAPHWIAALWMLFAITLNHSLRWLHGRPVLAALLGVAGGPLAYLAGARLGAAELVNAPAAVTALAIGWALFMPALLSAAAFLQAALEPRLDERHAAAREERTHLRVEAMEGETPC